MGLEVETPLGSLRTSAGMRMEDAHAVLARQQISRRRLLTGALAAAATGTVLWSRPGAAAVAPAGQHLAFGADPARSMAMSWFTPDRVAGAVVDLGLDRSYGQTLHAHGRGIPGTRSVYHHVRADRLRPDTTYHYRVRHAGAAGPDRTFRTAPTKPRPFRFTAFGDQGVNAAAAANVALIRQLKPAFHLHAGDLCYNAGSGTGTTGDRISQANWDPFFVQNAPVAASVPWMAGIGNHEMEPGYGEQGYGGFDARFLLPDSGVPGAPGTWLVRYGSVGVVSLDGNDASYEISANHGWLGSTQDRWLDRTLRSLRADPTIDFIVVIFHNCMYCTNAVHASDGGNRSRWEPLFDRHSVDLVINGHNHSYERTHPMRGGAVGAVTAVGDVIRSDRLGTTYVTAGGGGQAAYPVSLWPVSYVVLDHGVRQPEAADWSAVRYLDTSFLVVDVTPGAGSAMPRMRLRGVTPSGQLLDDLTLTRPSG